MKKSLIALAVLGTFGMGAAQAADTVQLYGIIDLGVAHFNNDGAGSVTKLGTGGQSGSRIGLKGTEDLGGGLSAFFQAETGFCANGGGGSKPGGASPTGALGGAGADHGVLRPVRVPPAVRYRHGCGLRRDRQSGDSRLCQSRGAD